MCPPPEVFVADITLPKTLWSETLFDLLVDAIRRNRADATIKEILRDLKKRGYKADYVLSKIERELGREGLARIKHFFKSVP